MAAIRSHANGCFCLFYREKKWIIVSRVQDRPLDRLLTCSYRLVSLSGHSTESHVSSDWLSSTDFGSSLLDELPKVSRLLPLTYWTRTRFELPATDLISSGKLVNTRKSNVSKIRVAADRWRSSYLMMPSISVLPFEAHPFTFQGTPITEGPDAGKAILLIRVRDGKQQHCRTV